MSAALRAAEAAAGREQAAGLYGVGGGRSRFVKGDRGDGEHLCAKFGPFGAREGGPVGGREAGAAGCPRSFRHGGAAELRGAWERPRGEPRAGGAESVAPLQPPGELGADGGVHARSGW